MKLNNIQFLINFRIFHFCPHFEKKVQASQIQTPLPIQPYRGEIVAAIKYLPSHMVITRKFKQNSDPASLLKRRPSLAPFPEEEENLNKESDKNGNLLNPYGDFSADPYKPDDAKILDDVTESRADSIRQNLKRVSITDFTGELHIKVEEARNLIPVRTSGEFFAYAIVRLQLNFQKDFYVV